MNLARRLLFALVAITAAVRAVCYVLHAAAFLPAPLEAYHLEAKMALLAYRVQLGASLYPRWDGYPHVTNFFGPVYFLLVGLLAAAVKADIPTLMMIGRIVTFLATLATTFIVWRVAARHYGRGPGALAAILTLGPSPMIGSTFMVRPDALADVLGLAGFVLSGARTRALAFLGGALLVAAILTKQTCALYLAAAVLALAFEGRRGAAAGLLIASTALLAAIVGGANAFVEPNFVASLLGEAPTPWATKYLVQTALQTLHASPDMFLLSAIGIGLWLTPAQRNVRFVTLAVVLLGGNALASGKCGASMNYYLCLRAVEGLAGAALWQAARAATGRARWGVLVCGALVLVAFVPSTVGQLYGAARGWEHRVFLASPEGQEYLRVKRTMLHRARNPKLHVLTDWGMLDLYQGERAAFGDPWLFRLMVLTGRIDPVEMKRRIDERYYDVVVTTSDIMSPQYPDGDFAAPDFGLPRPLAERVRAHYVPQGKIGDVYIYTRPGVADALDAPVAPRTRAW